MWPACVALGGSWRRSRSARSSRRQARGGVGPGDVPNDANGGKYEDWVRFMRTWTGDGATGSVGHQIGTCAMAREDLGGVVDSDLRVYGTRNVRVVDASVLPFSVSAHIQSTVYAIAETAAERILQLVHPELGAVTQASRGGKV